MYALPTIHNPQTFTSFSINFGFDNTEIKQHNISVLTEKGKNREGKLKTQKMPFCSTTFCPTVMNKI